METVKMPIAVQAKAGTAGKTTQTGFSDQSQGFVKLLQEKKDMAQPDKAQTKTEGKKQDSVLGKEDKAGQDKVNQTAEPEKEPKDQAPESGEESEGRDEGVQEALLQAGMWQTAAQLTGMMAENGQQEEAVETVLVTPDTSVSLETAGTSQTQIAAPAVDDGALIQTGGEEEVQTAAEVPAARQAGEELQAENLAAQAVQTGAGDTARAAEAAAAAKVRQPAETEASREVEEPKDTGQTAAVSQETIRFQKSPPESQEQEEAPDQDALLNQEKGESWQSVSRSEADSGENRGAAVQTGVSETRQERKAEQETGTTQEPVYRTDSVREPSWQSFAGEKTEEIPLRTSESQLPQDLGKTLAARFPGSGQELVIELEPAALGKLTIKLAYEGGRAAVSILASNPKTLEVLNQRATEIAAILEEKTGQETIIYTHAPEQQSQEEQEQQSQGGGGQEQRQEQQRRHEDQHQTESFAQQLRLGLI